MVIVVIPANVAQCFYHVLNEFDTARTVGTGGKLATIPNSNTPWNNKPTVKNVMVVCLPTLDTEPIFIVVFGELIEHFFQCFIHTALCCSNNNLQHLVNVAHGERYF